MTPTIVSTAAEAPSPTGIAIGPPTRRFEPTAIAMAIEDEEGLGAVVITLAEALGSAGILPGWIGSPR